MPLLAYDSEVRIEVDARVGTAAPGRATLALGLIAEWPEMRDSATGAAFVTVASSEATPTVQSLSPQAGDPDGDTELTINGENFELGAKVQFGTVYAAEVEVIDRNTLRVRTPRQPAGTVDVTVVNPEARAGGLPQAFAYEAAVDPTDPPDPPDPIDPTNPTNPGGGGGGGGAFSIEWLMLGALLLTGLCRRRRCSPRITALVQSGPVPYSPAQTGEAGWRIGPKSPNCYAPGATAMIVPSRN
jgi:hypothetical protein